MLRVRSAASWTVYSPVQVAQVVTCGVGVRLDLRGRSLGGHDERSGNVLAA